MNDPTIRQIYAQAIGELAISYFEEFGRSAAASLVQSRAVAAIFDMKNILDNPNLDEAESCGRIQAIVEKFYSEGFGAPH